eukprot:15401081-Alexandrium_andersonii.AAC.1
MGDTSVGKLGRPSWLACGLSDGRVVRWTGAGPGGGGRPADVSQIAASLESQRLRFEASRLRTA